MRGFAVIALLFLCTGSGRAQGGPAPSSVSAPACGPMGQAYTRTTLYFGLNRKTGNISQAQWRTFLRQEVTPRFPQGLTVWEANGQWRRADGSIARERAKVLLLVHGDTAPVQDAINAIIAQYKSRFDQESVLWETARVCAAF